MTRHSTQSIKAQFAHRPYICSWQ